MQCGLTSAFRSGVAARKIVRRAGNTPCGTSSVSTIVRYHHVGRGEKDEKGLGVDGRLCCDLVRRRFSSGTRDSKRDDESLTGSTSNANASPGFPKPANVTKPESESESKPKPKPRRYPRVHLLGRGQSTVQVTPTSTQIPIDTTLATSFTPANPRFPKPPYLSTKYARFIPVHAFTQSSPDSYVLTRSVELFGLPGKTDWIAKMKERAAAVSVRDKVTGLLSRLEWTDAGVRSLKNAAWAEHLAAMQNPRLERELEQDVDSPAWPSTEPVRDLPNSKPSLSWSMSGERDMPSSSYTSSPHAPAYTFGNHNFPRPKRIIRLRPYDKSLVLVFASPTARRAILAAYAQWIRKELRAAFIDRDNQEKMLDEGRGVWPPIDQDEIGGLRRGDSNYHTMLEAIEWAGRIGWRPAFRIQSFQGARRWGDEWHPRGRWSSSQAGREEE